MQLAAEYLLHARRVDQEPVNSAARFHLGNGERLERINWLGDVSLTGIESGAGIMVNYLYALNLIEKNHDAYLNEQKVIPSSEVRKLISRKLQLTVA